MNEIPLGLNPSSVLKNVCIVCIEKNGFFHSYFSSEICNIQHVILQKVHNLGSLGQREEKVRGGSLRLGERLKTALRMARGWKDSWPDHFEKLHHLLPIHLTKKICNSILRGRLRKHSTVPLTSKVGFALQRTGSIEGGIGAAEQCHQFKKRKKLCEHLRPPQRRGAREKYVFPEKQAGRLEHMYFSGLGYCVHVHQPLWHLCSYVTVMVNIEWRQPDSFCLSVLKWLHMLLFSLTWESIQW